MRVLIVHDYGAPIGGAEHVSLALRDGLRARGHEARLFGSRAQPFSMPLPILADDVCYGTFSPVRRVTQAINPFAAAALKRVIADFRPDVVHVRMFLTQLSPSILPILKQVPALLHVVNYDLICPLNTKLLPDGSPCTYRAGWVCHKAGCLSLAGMARHAVQQRGLRRHFDDAFDLVVTNSHWVRRKLEADGVRVDETIWNGVPVTTQRPPLGANAPPTIAFAGRLVAKKGVNVLIEAMARVVREVPGARLLIAGDGPDRPALENRARELGLGLNVSFLGHLPREEMERAFAAAWAQAAPSLWEEPFGLVAAEAMMRGTAAIVSDAGGLAEQVEHGVTGLKVPPGDVAACAEAIMAILGDRALAERMGAAGRARAIERFTEDRVLEQFTSFYERLVQRKRTAAEVSA